MMILVGQFLNYWIPIDFVITLNTTKARGFLSLRQQQRRRLRSSKYDIGILKSKKCYSIHKTTKTHFETEKKYVVAHYLGISLLVKGILKTDSKQIFESVFNIK